MAHNSFIPPSGLICPLITPLKDDKSIDAASLERLIKHIGDSADVILLGDVVWGEGLDLSEKARFELVVSALELIWGSLPVYITITGQTIEATRSFMARVDEFIFRTEYAGDIFWVDYPLVYHSNRGLPEMYSEMLSETQPPLIIGNLPSIVKQFKSAVKHNNIRTHVLKQVVQNRKVVGGIYTGTLKRFLNYQEAVRVRRDFVFYDGDERVFLKSPGRGGVIAGGSNLMPGVWRDVVKSSFNQYDIQRQFNDHQATIWGAGKMLHSLCSLYEGNPAFYIKEILKEIGFINSNQMAGRHKSVSATWRKDMEAFLSAYDIQ